MNSLSEGPLSFVVSIININNLKKNNENESVVDGAARRAAGTASKRDSQPERTSHRSALRQGYVVGAATGDRRDGRDVTGAGNDCPPHSYGYILSLEESALTSRGLGQYQRDALQSLITSPPALAPSAKLHGT